MKVSEGTVEKCGEKAEARNWVREREKCIEVIRGDHFPWYNEEKKVSIRVACKYPS